MKHKSFLALSAVSLSIAACSHLQMGLFILKDNPQAGNPQSISRGKAAFAENCAECHGVNADGQGPVAKQLEAAPTNFLAADYTKSANRIAGHIAYGKRKAMPAFHDKLSEETIWDIANYLHSLQKPVAQS